MKCLLVSLSLIALTATAGAGELLIETRLADDGSLHISYTPPAGVKALPRFNRSEAARDFWRQQVTPLDGCSRVDGEVIRLRAGCTTAHLRVEPTLLARTNTHEPAQPISGTGIVAHSGFYAVALAGHELRWRWVAPRGGYVLQDGRVHREVVEQVVPARKTTGAAASGGNTALAWYSIGALHYVYLGRAPLIEIPGGVLVRDPALDEERITLIRETLTRTMAELASVYGSLPNGPVGVVTSSAELDSFQGDIGGLRMMRIRLTLDPQLRGSSALQLQRFITHETVHWWNTGLRRSDTESPWIHEGHADWAALLLLRQRGLLDDRAFVSSTEAALSRCLSARGGALAALQDEPYSCGMSLMLLAQTQAQSRRNAADQRSPMALLADMHPVDAALDMSRFAAWADGRGEGPMRELLFNPGTGSFSTRLATRLQSLGLAEPDGHLLRMKPDALRRMGLLKSYESETHNVQENPDRQPG